MCMKVLVCELVNLRSKLSHVLIFILVVVVGVVVGTIETGW